MAGRRGVVLQELQVGDIYRITMGLEAMAHRRDRRRCCPVQRGRCRETRSQVGVTVWPRVEMWAPKATKMRMTEELEVDGS